jgi:hypothetical protein
MDIRKLVDQAKATSGAKNDREFAKLLGVSNAVPSQWRTGTTLPAPIHGQKLAELAQIDPAPVVAEILLLQTSDKGLRTTLERLKRAVAALIILSGTLPALSDNLSAMYIMFNRRRPTFRLNPGMC